MKLRPAPQTALALYELLAVAALLAVLLALLLPVYGRVRASANGVRCAANLRTIGVAVRQYATDRNGKFPPSRLQYEMEADGTRGTVSFLPDLLRRLKYLDIDNLDALWWCPGDVERPAGMRKHSYGMNQRIGGNAAPQLTWNGHPNPDYNPAYATFQGARQPLSQIIYLIDFVDKGDAGKWSSSVSGGRWPMRAGSTQENAPDARIDFSRHSRVANALFLDGSVRAQRFEDLAGTGTRHFSPE